MLRLIPALLLLLMLATSAAAQEQGNTRETPPPGRALPPAAVTTSAPADAVSRLAAPPPAALPTPRTHAPTARAARQLALAASRLAGALVSARDGRVLADVQHAAVLTVPGPAAAAAPPPAPVLAPPPGRFATGGPASAPSDSPASSDNLLASLPAEQGSALAFSAPLPGVRIYSLQHGLVLADNSSAALSGAQFSGSATAGPPLEMALPSGTPHMSAATLRSGLTEIVRGNPKQKRVALTFDDGPHPEFTSQLLAILDFYHIHATFFVVGVQAQKYPQWVKMIHQAGHELGNHSYDHFRMPALPAEEQAYQIDENQRLLEQLTGVTPRFFRPPGGRYDGQVSRLLKQRGMLLALWDTALNDTAEDREAGDLYSTASHKIRPGSVMLGHDGIQATIEMLPELIESLQKEGYTFVTMSELASGI